MKLACVMLALALVVAGSHAAGGEPDTAPEIRRHRMGTLIVLAAPGTSVAVEQTRHEFWFGAALANQAFSGTMRPADATRYREIFLANFNAAVTENALKWHVMERERGRVNYATVDAILDWTQQHEIPLRGHNIYWGVKQFVPPWQLALSDDELRQALEARGRDVGARYRGRFAEYDLNNEMMHSDYYAQRLGPGITPDLARWVKAADPDARLFVNDYDILTGRRLDDYVKHIRGLLEMGVPLAGIGVQGHSHTETFDRATLRRALDTLAQFKLPIRVTEFNLPGQNSKYYKHPGTPITDEEEAAKAREIVDFYRICFSHPAVAGILMWGFWEGANWIPVSSLYRRDWSPTPAAKAYHDLVYGEWWTRWQGRAGANGRCEVPAFFARYRVTIGAKQIDVVLRKQDGTATVDGR